MIMVAILRFHREVTCLIILDCWLFWRAELQQKETPDSSVMIPPCEAPNPRDAHIQ